MTLLKLGLLMLLTAWVSVLCGFLFLMSLSSLERSRRIRRSARDEEYLLWLERQFHEDRWLEMHLYKDKDREVEHPEDLWG